MIRLEEEEIKESVQQKEPEQAPMTRAEYVKYARMQCEKELAFFPWPTSPEEIAKASMLQQELQKEVKDVQIEQPSEEFQPFPHFDTLNAANEKEEEREEEIETDICYVEGEEELKDAVSINKLLRKEALEQEETDTKPETITKDSKDVLEGADGMDVQTKLSYMTKFTIRLIAAVLIAVCIITIDYFHIGGNQINSESIKTTISRNDTIESVEEAVTTFAKDKVLPVFTGNEEEK